jgi:hypothetical protein
MTGRLNQVIDSVDDLILDVTNVRFKKDIMEWVKNLMSKSVSWLLNNQKVPVEDRKEIMNIFRSDFFDLNNIIQIYQIYSNVTTFLLPLSKTTRLFINFYNQTRDGRFINENLDSFDSVKIEIIKVDGCFLEIIDCCDYLKIWKSDNVYICLEK